MKHLLTGVAVVAALAFAAPVGAQVSPSGGNAMGLPGPNPGGPGLTPYSTSKPPAPPPSAAAASDTSSAMPSKHRHVRHTATHAKSVRHRQSKAAPAQSTDSSANQLNQEELSRVQAGNFANPAAPAGPGMAPSPQ